MKYGFGRLYYSNKPNNVIKYIGYFINNVKYGEGIECNEDGTMFRKGTFINDQFVKGIKYMGLTPYYEGDFSNDLFHGYGKLYKYSNVLYYDGTFVNGIIHGLGKLYYDNGVVAYFGNFINNLKSGSGVEYNYTGQVIYSGMFLNDKYDLTNNNILNHSNIQQHHQYQQQHQPQSQQQQQQQPHQQQQQQQEQPQQQKENKKNENETLNRLLSPEEIVALDKSLQI